MKKSGFFNIIFISYFLLFTPIVYGSERLELYFLTKKLLNTKILNKNEFIQFSLNSKSLGFKNLEDINKKKSIFSINRAFYPIITYSDNINGGNLFQTIQIGGLTFEGEEEAKAKSGLLIGGGILVGIKKQYGIGRYLDVRMNASLSAAPTQEWLSIRDESIIACSKNHLKEWFFFDACAHWGHNKRQYIDEINKSLSVSLTKLFISKKVFSESIFTINRHIADKYHQLQGIFALNSLLPNGYKTNFSMAFGEPVKDLISLNYSLGLSVSKYIKRKPLSILLNQTYYDGGKFLGVDREDTSQKISISYPIHSRFNIALGYTRNMSSISSFSHNGPHIEVSFPALIF